eukprot:SAG11_NODE_7817_length_1092_cov_2.016113_1_plen_45_part_10
MAARVLALVVVAVLLGRGAGLAPSLQLPVVIEENVDTDYDCCNLF